MPLPHAPITEIPTSPKPAAVPSLWNTRYVEIDENFAYLEDRLNNMAASQSPVSTPVLTGDDFIVVDIPYDLSMRSTASLPGATIASFTVTKPDSTTATISAVDGEASLEWTQESGSIGNTIEFNVYAEDSIGNKSATVVKTVEISGPYVKNPTITSPTQGQTNVYDAPTFETAVFAVVGGADTHESTDWELRTGPDGGGSVVWSSIDDTANKTSLEMNAGIIDEAMTYYLRVRFKGDSLGYSGWSEHSFRTANNFFPTIPGTPYGGGYYAGRIVISGNTYALIVAPKSQGNSGGIKLKNTETTTVGTTSLNNGMVNSNAGNDVNHPAIYFCRNLNIAGYTDWYLPSRDELEICYRNLKPSTNNNNTGFRTVPPGGHGVDGNGNGYNANSSPIGSPYTTEEPEYTVAEIFQQGNAEAFNTDNIYYSSTEIDFKLVWGQYFVNGEQTYFAKTPSSYNAYARAVRKILIP